MPFAYYSRLNARQKRIYRRSDEVSAIELPRPAALRVGIGRLAAALAEEERGAAEASCQELSDGMTDQLEMPPARILVLAVRPRDGGGELQGLYEPEEAGNRARISLWMRTAKRRQVVAFRTFLRTLLHELCHHIDYELLGFEETFHTEGFYQRESSLFHQLVPPES